MEWMPQIGGFSIGVVLAVILEFAKAFGVSEDSMGRITVVLGVIWVALGLATSQYPQALPWVTWGIQVLLALAAVPIGAKVGYKVLVEPVSRKRWNVDKS